MTTTIINPEQVLATFYACLFEPEEVQDGKPPDNAVVVDGIMAKYAFHPARLASHRDEVKGWLALLPVEFQADGGGGWSFLNACYQADGHQWTGLHERMEQLFCLGMGLGFVKCQMPREMWSIIPGGMPYYGVDVRGE